MTIPQSSTHLLRVRSLLEIHGIYAITALLVLRLLTSCTAVPANNGDGSGTQNPSSDSSTDNQAGQTTTPGSAPSPRGGAPAVWMPSAQKMVLFGGMAPITGDTHEYDPTLGQWRQIVSDSAAPLPAPRCHHTFVAIPGTDAGLLFGGFSFTGRFNDVWRYDADADSWSQLTATGDMPQRRCLHGAAFIESRNQMLTYGGISGGGILSSDFFEDTHLFDLDTGEWTRLDITGPGKLEGPVVFYAAADDAVYLWGGKQVDRYATGLWRFDVDQQTWSPVGSSGDLPLGREDPTWFWDESRGILTIFSGRNDDTPRILFDDAYELDLASAAWTSIEVDPKPDPRWRASMVMDSTADQGFMFGGWIDFGGNQAFNDLWTYDPAQRAWTELAPQG